MSTFRQLHIRLSEVDSERFEELREWLGYSDTSTMIRELVRWQWDKQKIKRSKE